MREQRLESNETEKDDATVETTSDRSNDKENQISGSVNHALSPISKSSRGEEDLYINENDDREELDKLLSSNNASEHLQTNLIIHISPTQSERNSEDIDKDLQDRHSIVSSESDDAKLPNKHIFKPDNVLVSSKNEVDDKDEKSSCTSSEESHLELRLPSERVEEGKEAFEETYEKLSTEHSKLQQEENDLATNNNKEVPTNNSSSNYDEMITERSKYIVKTSVEQSTFPNEGHSKESDYTGHRLESGSDHQKFEPSAEKKDIPIDNKEHGSPHPKYKEDQKSLINESRLELSAKGKNSQTQFRNVHSQSKSNYQIQSGSRIKTSFKTNNSNDKQTANACHPDSKINVQSSRMICRKSGALQRSNEPTQSKNETVARQHLRRMTKSASPTLFRMKRPETRNSRPYSQARTEVSPEARKKQEFFRLELRRLKTGLEKEASKIIKPKERDFFPFVWTSLAPYYDTTTAQYLIPLDKEEDKNKEQKDEKEENTEEKHTKKRSPEMQKLAYEKSIRAYLTRNTAIGLCDPWVDLHMDKGFLEFPKIETSEEKQRKQPEEMDKVSSPEKKEKAKKNRPPKEGSTRLPKFPVITLEKKELATKPLHYNDVPMLRSEFEATFSLKSKERMRKDYKRTKEDFYRMELDRLNEIHILNRHHMRQAYFAYLQNTPGSRHAIYDCMVESGFKEKKNNTSEKPRNESPTSQQMEVKAQ